MPRTLENPFYYLENFLGVLDWIARRHGDLLDATEQDFITGFTKLPEASQALLVRMVMRKGELFRQSKLRYPEIGDTQAAVGALATLGWVDTKPQLTLEDLFGLLRKDELAQALAPAQAGTRKTELLERLRSEYGTEVRSLDGWCPDLADQAYGLRVGAICERFRLLYFGNLYQDWSEFVLADLGIFSYEPVTLSPESRAFQNRADVDAYLHLYQCRTRLQEGTDPTSVLADVPALPYANPWLEGRRARLLFQLGQQQEKAGDWPAALNTYGSCAYPGARARRIRVLERYADFTTAHALAEAALLAPESEEEEQQLQRTLPRLRRKLGLPAMPTARLQSPAPQTLTLPQDPELSVEMLVCTHLSQPDAPVFYVENALINSLFGLLCWPAVFAPLPGAFFHPFQQGPADLHSPDFYQRRASLFDSCLAQLGTGTYRDTILATFAEKQNRQSPFVFWGALDEELLALALDCIPAQHLRLLFARLLLDIKTNRTGFPDLVRFWPGEQRYQMLEVKGPGDRLQDNQRRWLDYCLRHDMPVGVCHVQWATP